MQLIYLWINDSRTLFREQNFNFSSEFSFKTTKANKELHISYERNPNFIKNFWKVYETNTIIEVTAIVGRNGSGKTSLLSFIRDNLANDIGIPNLSYVCIFKIHGREKYTVYNSTGLNTTISTALDIGQLSFEFTKRGNIDNQLVSLKYPTNVFHYSPLLNLNSDNYSYPIDLSTTHYVSEIGADKSNKFKSFSDFQYKEFLDQLNFIINNRDIIKFELPNSCSFSLKKIDYEDLSKRLDPRLNENFVGYFSNMVNNHAAIMDSEKDESLLLAINFWLCVQFELLKKFIDKGAQRESDFKIFNYPYIEKANDFLNKLVDNVKELARLVNFNFDDLFFDNRSLTPFVLTEQVENIFPDGFEIALNRQTQDSTKRFLEKIKNNEILKEVFTLEWSGLSTGETSFINLFSRFYNSDNEQLERLIYINDCRTTAHNMGKIRKINDAIVIIDEGETGLHPQWQKDYVMNLVKELPKLLDYERIQLIFTTNNPIVLSDMPNENCIFLKKENGMSKIDNPKKQSFGANIIDLFRTSFFVDGGLIGGLAKEKLNKLVEKLFNKDVSFSQDELDDAAKLINLIGDEMIRIRMKDLLADRLNKQ